MRFMKYLLCLLLTAAAFASCEKKYSYETVEGDPMAARIYTLDNGLKVYMSVNKDEPRIQTYVVVRVGGKNDPAETTGMAHYFEHLMFKGTQQFGTTDYQAEKPLLEEIERLFEVYRKTSDEEERAALYRTIDSISYEASKIAIPNEYDKLMSAIGSSGTNASTSFDRTAYVENIPSNQLENWALIQSDRFKNVVIRGFHTELETIYEEKNMSLTNDGRKTSEKMLELLYPSHPYGQQTVLGTQDHLKNPSITLVKKYHADWYVPNNMAVVLAGDFDPEEAIRVIDKYFGDMKRSDNIPQLEIVPEKPITEPVIREVYGLDAPYVTMAWRSGGATDPQAAVAEMTGSVLYNGRVGLIDLDINQQQKTLSSYAGNSAMTDYGYLTMRGNPKQGQSLEQVKDLLLAEIDKLRRGEFDESMLQSIVNNRKMTMMNMLDRNQGRAGLFVNVFTNGIDWKDQVSYLDRLAKVTKDDIVRFANEKFQDNNYVLIYKRQGPDPNEQRMSKPPITPIVTNRDLQSDFLRDIKLAHVTPIEPVFVDFDKDMSVLSAKAGIPVLYKKNETTDMFTLTYLFEVGTNDNPSARTAFNYLNYLGTGNMTAEDIKREFYNIACSYYVNMDGDRTYVNISGLSENMGKAMELFESLIADAKGDDAVLRKIKEDMVKQRANSKATQAGNQMALAAYATYGPEYIKKTVLSDRDIRNLSSAKLLGDIQGLMNLEHRILYYGPLGEDEVLSQIEKYHRTPEKLSPVTNKVHFRPLPTPSSKVLLAQYDAAQIIFSQEFNSGTPYDSANDADVALYNEYFGGGMNAIVFQEMREARGLAYRARASLIEPDRAEENYDFNAFIYTQSDKMGIAIDAFDEIINDMPVSQAAFDIAKESLLQRLRTQRTIKANVLSSYITAQDRGLDYDRNKVIFEKAQTMTLDDVVSFQQKWIKGRPFTYSILGDIKALDMNKLRSMGPVTTLSKEEIFGY